MSVGQAQDKDGRAEDERVIAELSAAFPPKPLQFRLLWEAMAKVGPRQDLGVSPLGERWIIPILGGVFRGGPGRDGFRGGILPGGADRQVLRRDGIKELDAFYEMQVDDGTILTIRNRVLLEPEGVPDRYALSQLRVTAPEGPWEGLNRRVIVGTLHPAMPRLPAVLIRAWEVDAR